MNSQHQKILVVQTAFIGDVILTLPMVQILQRELKGALVDCLVIPVAAPVLENHPSIHRVVVYDKRGIDSGFGGFIRTVRLLRKERYDVAIVPHRSIRSALLVALAGIRRRIGFTRSAGRFLFTDTVRYDEASHETDRNIALARAILGSTTGAELPSVYPSSRDESVVNDLLRENNVPRGQPLVAVAPGSVWFTKRWPAKYFQELTHKIVQAGMGVVYIGGKEDAALCKELAASGETGAYSAAGRLTLLQSAAMLKRCCVLVSNDSAPMHLAVAVRTPVIAIFGATIPGFGFAPRGKQDLVIETDGLRCRPCSIHGGTSCPIGSFDCMKNITPDRVWQALQPYRLTETHI